MTPTAVLDAQAAGAFVVDTRPLACYTAGHLPGALPIEFNLADLAERAALLLPPGVRVVVHAEPEASVEASVGLLEDAGCTVLGHLEGGLSAWRAAGLDVATMETIDADQLAAAGGAYGILDVREPFEYRHGHLEGAQLLPSGEAFERITAGAIEPPEGRPFAVFCSGWGRAAFVAGLLQARDIPAVLVAGGMYSWQQRGHPVVVRTG